MTRRFLALGDSYTIGEGVGETEPWPGQLVRRLQTMRVPVGEPEIVATTGWTTEELLAGMERLERRALYDLVTLLIGVNDQYRGWSESRFTAGFRALLERATTLAAGGAAHVVVISIPDWSVTPFGARDPRGQLAIAAEIDRFNAIARREAEEKGASFVNITATSREAASEPALLAADGLHPSGAMYARWTELLLQPSLHALTAS